MMEHPDQGNHGSQPPSHISHEALERLRARQRRDRESRIDALVVDAERKGQSTDRAYWSLVYDLELAPIATNRAQLLEIGVDAPPVCSISDAAVSTHLHRLIQALAELQTYLVHTDHLTDRELYERLVGTILDEPVREISPGSGGREFIDLSGGLDAHAVPRTPCVDRDRNLPRPSDTTG